MFPAAELAPEVDIDAGNRLRCDYCTGSIGESTTSLFRDRHRDAEPSVQKHPKMEYQ